MSSRTSHTANDINFKNTHRHSVAKLANLLCVRVGALPDPDSSVCRAKTSERRDRRRLRFFCVSYSTGLFACRRGRDGDLKIEVHRRAIGVLTARRFRISLVFSGGGGDATPGRTCMMDLRRWIRFILDLFGC